MSVLVYTLQGLKFTDPPKLKYFHHSALPYKHFPAIISLLLQCFSKSTSRLLMNFSKANFSQLYIALKTWTHKQSLFVKIHQTNFASRARLNSKRDLNPSPPSFLRQHNDAQAFGAKKFFDSVFGFLQNFLIRASISSQIPLWIWKTIIEYVGLLELLRK